ncbi:MAG TPA: hypothetical protein VLC74_06625 [Rhizomicrobium sp.]|nr:hypothetical protein [Rhizomicrobium sp.]
MNAICRHFGACGGCSLQHLAPEAYLHGKRRVILDALQRHGVSDPPSLDIVSAPPRSRRRATLKLRNADGQARIGFYASRSHALIDIRECHVLTPGLFQLAQGLRDLLGPMVGAGESANLYMVEAENGFDLAIEGMPSSAPELTGRVATAMAKHGLLRVTIGGDLLCQSGVPEVTFGKGRVMLPPNAFLQPTREGEAALQAQVKQAIGKAKRIADLFSGCGTFALPLAERGRVHAVDADRPMLGALASAARSTPGLKPLTTESRDLFKQPLTPAELNRFDAVVLDPPRAGALAQVTQLSRSTVSRIAYVSCNAASFARDTRILIDGGFRLDGIVGVDQFLWSAHIELAAAFSR